MLKHYDIGITIWWNFQALKNNFEIFCVQLNICYLIGRKKARMGNIEYWEDYCPKWYHENGIFVRRGMFSAFFFATISPQPRAVSFPK